ncbi:MAG: serine/threonine-protein phosphatase [Clostridia bacterium]|nr:serine/threonine-protein phosphatase [Clostridia bacterium]MCI2000134.1 serine/threonine-protein phosphatase [Clostridia bacterium]MCI2014701.1 serine/threonine-protein phosphatase [Clostridia bacterium]
MYFIDAASKSINKAGEELCGDHVEYINLVDSKILVLSDGLGSGVKANILATLTSKIAATMLKEGATIEETVDTIVHTLPICRERHLAYSTFTIIRVFNDGRAYIAEFDSPSVFVVKNGERVELKKVKKTINNKQIYESSFTLDKDSLLVAVSDGVIHAGVGHSLALGWQWKNICKFLQEIDKNAESKQVVDAVLDKCREYYENEAGDDATAIAVKIRKQETINLFTGPPKDPDKDYEIIKKILQAEGKVVVCGGTSSSIVARTLGVEMEVDLSTMTVDIPPVGIIKGIELVTEGVITIGKALDIMKDFMSVSMHRKAEKNMQEKNAAAMLATLLIERCDNLNLWVGQAVNPVHQRGNYPMDFQFKMNQIKELASVVENMGKKVNIIYI